MNIINRFIIIFSLITILATNCNAAQQKSLASTTFGHVENDTYTHEAMQFYRLFCQLWWDNKLSTLVNLTIQERPLYGRNQQLIIKYRGIMIYKIILHKRLLIDPYLIKQTINSINKVVSSNYQS